MKYSDNIIPSMTSNTAPSGVVSTGISDYIGTVFYIFSRNNTAGIRITATTTGWVSYKFPEKRLVGSYSMLVGAYPPKSFRFEGSNDNASWTTLNTQIGLVWTGGVRKTFTISSPSLYQWYRVYVTEPASVTFVDIANITMHEVIYDKKTLIYNDGKYKRYDNGLWTALSDSLSDQLYLSYGHDDISTISESAWAELKGDIELCYYTDDSTKSEVQFTIETEPFTLEDEFEDKAIKIIEYTDNPIQTESTITLETEPFTLYDEFGDSVDVLYYTDDLTKTSAELSINANYSPLDEIDGDFDVVTYVEEDENVILAIDATPFKQLLLQPEDHNVYGKLQSLLIAEGVSPLNATKIILSFDSGATWETCKYKKWKTIDHTNKEIILSQGMSLHDISKLNENLLKEKSASGKIKIGYLIDDNIHIGAHTIINNTKLKIKSSTGTVKFSDLAFYILNTAATIQVTFAGNKLSGELSDDDLGKVQYRVLLNGIPYYPDAGQFTPLLSSPQAINLNINDRKVLFGVSNTLRVEFKDAWGQQDFWETTFIGTYSGIMFMDETKKYYSNSFGEILKYLDFGVIIAGQTTLEQKIVVKNQMGFRVQNLLLEIVKSKLPEGVTIELSRSNFPFVAEDPLLFNRFFNEDEEFVFYVRIVTQLTAPPAPNGTFEIRAKADTV